MVDVTIAGFGPTGAAMAGLLARRGVSVLVLEKDTDVFPLPRAAHIDHTSLRTIQELGCLDRVMGPMIRNQGTDLVNHDHEVLLRIPAGQDSVSNLPTSVYFYQPEMDRTLRETVAAMPGVEVKLGTELLGYEADASGVRIRARGPDGSEQIHSASWLIGCDGSWSPVREGMPNRLIDLGFEERWLVLDLRLTGSHDSLPLDRAVQVCDPERPHLTTPIAANRQRFEFMLLPGEDPEVMRERPATERLLASWLHPEAYEVERSATYKFHGLTAEHWRRGRVMIAGDAAHMMPPFLGQGMCSGLRDAANLAWKLAGVIHGRLRENVLDTYQAERNPHVRRIIEASIGFGRLVCITDPKAAAERDKRFLTNGQTPEERASFALPRFEPGPLVRPGGGMMFIQPTIDGQRLDDIVGTRFLVIAATEKALGSTASWWEGVGALVKTSAQLACKNIDHWLEQFNAQVVVVRPDRYVLGTAANLDTITAAVGELFTQVGASRSRSAGAR